MTPTTDAPAVLASSRIGRGLAMAAMGLLLMNVLLVGWDVMLRWVARSPQSWVSDIAAMSYPVALACCIPAALESGHMIAIQFLGHAIGPRTTRILDFLGSMLLAGFLALIAWKVAERSIADLGAGYTTANVSLPLAPTWVVVAALLAVAALVQSRLTWRAWRSFRRGSVHG